jgi:predicted Zn finger-like uncharacterized protein
MPKMICPACQSEVKSPKKPVPGGTVKCPACEEVFTLPRAKPNASHPDTPDELKAPCPECRTEVKYPRHAKRGTTVTCPVCEEVFSPPGLEKKAYDPDDEGEYKVEAVETGATETDKAKNAAEAKRGGQRRQRELDEMEDSRQERKGWFEGPELVLVFVALGAAVLIPLVVFLTRR